MSGNVSIAGAIQDQVKKKVDEIVDVKIQEIILTVQARWQDRVNRRITEAEWAVKQGRIYNPEHALLKIYDAYRWVADHVQLSVDIAHNANGANITMQAVTNDGSDIDDYRQERIGECIGDLTKQLNYAYF